ncbi:MAG: TRAP transporter large permease [Bryobacteraceae bacterium]
MEWVIILGTVFGLVFSGLWLGIALGITGWVVLHFLADGAESMIGSAVWNGIQMYSIVAVSCFILMGQIILRSGISKRLYNSLSPLMERIPGGLLHTNIALCALFASVFGTSAATTAVVGSTAFPELKARNYDYKLTLGTVAAGGTLGILIPPSAAFIIYGALTGVSIGALFAAGILPGILMALMFSTYVMISAIRNPEIAPRSAVQQPLGASLKALLGLWPIVLLIAVVLVPIFAGWATATEASGVGVVGGLIVGKFHGKLTLKDVIESVKESTQTFVMLMFVVAGAMIFSNAVAIIGLPRQLTMTIGELQIPGVLIIVGLILMYLALGCLFDGISFMVMTLPFVFPIIHSLGFGGIWFGVLLVILIELGQLTPPVGVNLFIIQAIAEKGTTLEDVVRSIWPFFWILLFGAIIIVVFPGICTFVPSLLGFDIK